MAQNIIKLLFLLLLCCHLFEMKNTTNINNYNYNNNNNNNRHHNNHQHHQHQYIIRQNKNYNIHNNNNNNNNHNYNDDDDNSEYTSVEEISQHQQHIFKLKQPDNNRQLILTSAYSTQQQQQHHNIPKIHQHQQQQQQQQQIHHPIRHNGHQHHNINNHHQQQQQQQQQQHYSTITKIPSTTLYNNNNNYLVGGNNGGSVNSGSGKKFYKKETKSVASVWEKYSKLNTKRHLQSQPLPSSSSSSSSSSMVTQSPVVKLNGASNVLRESRQYNFNNNFNDNNDNNNNDYNNYGDTRQPQMRPLLKSLDNNNNRNRQQTKEDDYYEDEEQETLQTSHINTNTNTGQYREDTVENLEADTYIPGRIQQHKLQNYATREGVERERANYLRSQTNNRLAEKALVDEHIRNLYRSGGCKWPRPKVIAVKNVADKIYTPHCTILHRCGNDTGCCNSDTHICAEKFVENVHLYFYVQTLGVPGLPIERLTFVNHTECHCVDRFSTTEVYHHHHNHHSERIVRDYPDFSCKCPGIFERIIQENGECRCDCSTGNTQCDGFKKGREHLSIEDRKCISDGRCKIPVCEFDIYQHRIGRCPRKEEQMDLVNLPQS